MIVADTCAVLWLAFAPAELSKTAARTIEKARNEGGLAICAVTLYEIAWLAAHDRIELVGTVEAFLAEVEADFIVLPVTAKVAEIAANLPESFPGDPMDRLIGATALSCGVSLITKDRAIRRSKAVEVVW